MINLGDATKLRALIRVKKGKPPLEQPYEGPEAEVYLTPEYLRGRGSTERVRASTNAVRARDGDTIVLWDGSNAGEVFLGRDGLLASTMARVSHPAEFDRRYFFYSLKRVEPLLKARTSGTGVPHVDREFLESVEILRIEKAEQCRVADVMTAVDTMIEQTECAIAKRQRMLSGLFADLISRGVDGSGRVREEAFDEFTDSPLGRVPKAYKLMTFEQITPRDAPIGYGIVQPGVYDHDGVRVAGIYTINSAFERWHMSSRAIEGAYARSRIRTGDVLLSIKGTIGRVGVVPEGREGNISRELARIRPTSRINPTWLRYLVLSPMMQRQLAKAEVGTTRAELSIRMLRQLVVLVPSRDEQDEVAERLASFEAEIASSIGALAKARALRAGLLDDLLAGARHMPLAKGSA